MVDRLIEFSKTPQVIRTAVVASAALLHLAMAQPAGAETESTTARVEQIRFQSWEQEALRAVMVAGAAGGILTSVGRTLKAAESATKTQRAFLYSGLGLTTISFGAAATLAETILR